MTSRSQPDHPELLLGPNPLLESMSPFVPTSRLPDTLFQNPLQGLDWRSIQPEYRIPLLEQIHNYFFPTPIALDIAAAIQSAMRSSLVRRNPLSQPEQKRINQIGLIQADRGLEFSSLQPLACIASGGITAAQTGMGKTTIARHAAATFAPEQVIVHSRSEACGWSKLTQVMYLHVGLPSNGSRGGLLANILGALDALLGTDYALDLRRCRNLDQAILLTLKRLSIHRVALLILDEGQPDNLEECEWQREFVLFFLAMMNLGIPILLCGHPAAFRTLRAAGQLVRRFCSIGTFDLERAKENVDTWWADAFAPGMMRFSLCDQIADSTAMIQASRKLSAGVPGLFALLWVDAQRIALNRSGSEAIVSLNDLTSAAGSLGLRDLSKMAKWLEEPPADAVCYSDLQPAHTQPGPPPNRAESPEPNTAASKAEAVRNGGIAVLEKLAKKARETSRRKASQAAKDREMLQNLSAEDLRKSTRTLDLLAGLDEFQADLFDKVEPETVR